ncbi:MAG: porin family protein [Thermonemataceae bacterium]
MKRISVLLAIIVLSFITITSTFAQNATIGIKGGLNLSNLYTDNADDENVRAGFHAGFVADIPASDYFSIRPELLYSGKGMEGDYNIVGFQGTQRFSLHYIEVPVLAVLKLGEYIELHGGMYGAYLLSANIETEGSFDSSEELDTDNFQRFDWGLAVGGQVNLIEGLGVGIRYNRGFADVADSNTTEAFLGDAKNSVLQFYVSFGL